MVTVSLPGYHRKSVAPRFYTPINVLSNNKVVSSADHAKLETPVPI